MAKRRPTNLKPPFLKRVTFDRSKATSEEFPFSVPAFAQSFDLEFRRPITIFTGENGTGKSTILELIAQNCGFNVLGGSRNHNYLAQGVASDSHLTQLAACTVMSWLPKVSNGFFLRAETFFNFLEYIIGLPDWELIERYYGGNLLKKSHGEAFLAFFSNALERQGVYLFDEPEAALSPRRQIEFLRILREVEERGNAQIIMITHSPLLMSYPNADLRDFSYRGISPGELEATDHFRVMKAFYQDPTTFVERALARSDDEDDEEDDD